MRLYKFQSPDRALPPAQNQTFNCERYLQGQIEFLVFEPVSQHNRTEASLSKQCWALCCRGEYTIIFTSQTKPVQTQASSPFLGPLLKTDGSAVWQ